MPAVEAVLVDVDLAATLVFDLAAGLRDFADLVVRCERPL